MFIGLVIFRKTLIYCKKKKQKKSGPDRENNTGNPRITRIDVPKKCRVIYEGYRIISLDAIKLN